MVASVFSITTYYLAGWLCNSSFVKFIIQLPNATSTFFLIAVEYFYGCAVVKLDTEEGRLITEGRPCNEVINYWWVIYGL